MEGALRRSLGSQAQHTHTLWKTIHGLSNRAPPHTLNTSITFNNKIATPPKHIANCFNKQFTNTVKHATHKTNRHINRATHSIQGYNITLTTFQVQEAIKYSSRGVVASAPDLERAGWRFDSHCGNCFKSGKSECNNSGYKLTGLTWWPWWTGEVLIRDSWD